MVGLSRYLNFFNTNDYAPNNRLKDQALKPDEGCGFSPSPEQFTQPTMFNIRQRLFPADTYELFAFCIEARSYALGAQSLVKGPFTPGLAINLNKAGFSYGSAHKGHSAQIHSTNMQRASFWNQFLLSRSISQ